MKNKTLLLAIVIGLWQTGSAQVTYLADSIYGKTFDAIDSTWHLNSKTFCSLASGCLHQNSSVTFLWDTLAHTGTPNSRSYLSFNQNNRLTFQETQVYNNGNWIGRTKYNYSYTGNNKTEVLQQNWKNHLSAYRNQRRQLYQYNSYNAIDTVWQMGWDTVLNAWAPDKLTVYTYNPDTTAISGITYKYAAQQSTYNSYSKEDYTYVAGRLNVVVGYNWNSNSSTWDNSYRQTFTYSAQWFDTGYLQEAWDDVNSVWQKDYKQVYVVDANGNWLEDIYLVWYNDAWQEGFKDEFFLGCQMPTGVEEVRVPYQLSIYPNPASGMLTLDCSADHLNRYRIVDINGREAGAGEITLGQNHISLSGLAKGMYFIQLSGSSQQRVTRKFVVE